MAATTIQIVTDGYDSARHLFPAFSIVNLEVYILSHGWPYHYAKHKDGVTKSYAYEQTLTEGAPARDYVRDLGFSYSP